MTHQSRSGFALPVAVLALVAVGVMVTGGFYMARQETRIGLAAERGATAFYLAERGAMEVMCQWDPQTFGTLANWATATVADTVEEGAWSVAVTRMTDRLYYLQSTGAVTEGSAVFGTATRTMGFVARLNSAEVIPKAALSTVGEIRVQGSMEIIGHDQNPSAWSGYCSAPGPSKPGILIDDLSNITEVGNALTVDGSPAEAQDPTLTSDTLLTFGELGFDDLAAMADKVYAPNTKIRQLTPDSVSVGGAWTCKTSLKDNWGTPAKPGGACGGYFPIIYAQGNLEIAANALGQGMLLVEGDLEISGTHIFYGPVIIKGTLWATGGGTGGHFMGGVIAANVVYEESRITGNAVIEYSSCAVNRAILNNSSLTRIRPLTRRNWVDLSALAGG